MLLLLLWDAEMPRHAHWKYTPQDLEEALRLLNEDREIKGYNNYSQWINKVYYYNIANLSVLILLADYQRDQAFLQGSTYTYKVQSDEGQEISITAKQVNPCTFSEIAIGINKSDNAKLTCMP